MRDRQLNGWTLSARPKVKVLPAALNCSRRGGDLHQHQKREVCTLFRIFHQNDEGWVMTRRMVSQCRSVNRSSRWWFAELKGRCSVYMLDKEKKQSKTIIQKITTVLLPRGVILAPPRELLNVTGRKKTFESSYNCFSLFSSIVLFFISYFLLLYCCILVFVIKIVLLIF